MNLHFVHYEIFDVKRCNINERRKKAITVTVNVQMKPVQYAQVSFFVRFCGCTHLQCNAFICYFVRSDMFILYSFSSA